MRLAVAAQKVLQPKHISVASPPHDYWPTAAGLEQAHPTQDEGAHDPLTEFRFCNEQGPETLSEMISACTGVLA